METEKKQTELTISANGENITAAQFDALWKVSNYLGQAGFNVTMSNFNVIEDVVITGDADLKVVKD